MGEETAFRYKAFISYRHTDPDMQVARELHRRIESYGIPGAARRSSGMKKMGRVFRDQEELPTSISLSQDINDALRESEWLIVVCSPRLVQSRWCLKEIDTFIELGKRDHILTILAEGEPDESFPAQLRFVTLPDGTTEEIEPLAADIRAADWPGMKKKLKTEKLRLLAPMLGVAFDDLRRRQRERFLRITAAIAGAAILGLSSFLAYALHQNSLIARERNTALTSQSLFLADLSRQELAKGDPMLAMLLAEAALPAALENPDRPLVGEAAAALKTAELSLAGGQFVPAAILPLAKPYQELQGRNLCFLTGEDGRPVIRVLSSDAGVFAQVTDWDARTGAVLRSESVAVGDPSFVYLDPAGGVVLNYHDYAEILPLWDKEKIRVPFLQPFDYPDLRQNPAAPELLLFFQYDHAELYDARTGKTVAFELPVLPNPNEFAGAENTRPNILSAALSDDGSRVALGFEDRQIPYRGEDGEIITYFTYLDGLLGVIYDARSGEKLAELRAPMREGRTREVGTKNLLYDPRGDVLASVSSTGDLRLWDAATGRLLGLADKTLRPDNRSAPNDRRIISFHEESGLLAAVSEAGNIAVLDLQGGLVSEMGGQSGKTAGAEWGRGAKKDLLLAWENGEAGSEAILYDYDGNRFRWIMSLTSDQPALWAEFCPTDEPAIAVWRRQSLQIWRSGAAEDLTRRFPTDYVHFFMEWSPDGRYAAVGGMNRISVFDPASGALVNEIETHKMETSGDYLNSIHWSADGRRLTASWAKGVFVLDPLTGAELWRPQTIPPEMLNSSDKKSLDAGNAAESPDGALLAVTRQYGRDVAVYSAAGELVCRLSHPADWTGVGIEPLRWSPDSRAIVTTLPYFSDKGERDMSRDSAIVWDARTSEKLAELTGCYAAFSPDGRYLAVSADDALTLYDAAADFAAADSLPLTADGKIADVLFSPDGKLVACGDLIWNRENGSATALVSAEGDIAGFSPDGSACLAGSAIYDAVAGSPILTLPGTGVTRSPMAFNAEGTAVLLQTLDDLVVAAVTVPDLEEAYALGRRLTGGRELTPAEKQKFFLTE
ncbi:MAG: TIR domain-containing protein [Gracilibacteraceae bacterium]|jgi:WD40 repeat protein|nr:TIR domain-containing protein [Gracilibacteraceae bacterium]